MTKETRDEIAAHLCEKLTSCAEGIRQGGAMTDRQLAAVFMRIGLTLARDAHGPVQAAEWARDMADEAERDSFPLNGPMQ